LLPVSSLEVLFFCREGAAKAVHVSPMLQCKCCSGSSHHPLGVPGAGLFGLCMWPLGGLLGLLCHLAAGNSDAVLQVHGGSVVGKCGVFWLLT
jgi:hypothetical protein